MKAETLQKRMLEACGWTFYEGKPMWIHGRPPPFEADVDIVLACNAHPELVKALEAVSRLDCLKEYRAINAMVESALALAGRALQSDGKEKE